MKKLTLEEAEFRMNQFRLLEKQLKVYQGVARRFMSNFECPHEKGKLSDVETEFIVVAEKVHDTFVKASTQYRIAISIGDRLAADQAHCYIQTLINWHTKADLQIYFLEEYSKIKNLTTEPKLMYYKDIRKIN